MTDSDYNAIRPVESLQTIQGLTSIQRRQEHEHRQDAKSGKHDKPEAEPEEIEQAQTNPPDEDSPHSIDYCA
ncbi:hypothetical protein [Anaerobaca lacustris]|uniref:Uncharacterized protein n=1 Tax=Anaerobaca lacustris TaxID=3044600 RepID=A0AAW6TR16_9BACT|nr:hypothetical protein [Sedimentisphaerales bacterium M17dextr]